MIDRFITSFRSVTRAFQTFQVFRYGFLLLITVVFAWIFEDKEVIAAYERLVLLGGSLTFFWISGIFNSFVPLYHRLEAPRARQLVGQTFISTLLLSGLAAAVLWAYGKWTLDPEEHQALNWFALFIFLNSASYLVKFYFLVRERSFLLMGYGILAYFLHFLFITIPLILGYDLEVSMMLLAGLGGMKFLFQLIMLRKKLIPGGWDWKLFREQVYVAAPLILSIFLGGSANYLDALLVNGFLPDDTFALFQYGARELPLVMLLANAMSVTQSGMFTRKLKENKLEEALGEIKSGANRLQHWFFPLSMVLLLSSDFLYEWVFNSSFSESARVFDIYLLLVVPRLLFPQTIIKGHLRNVVLSVVAAIELALNAGFSLLAILLFRNQPEIAIQGVALATLLAFGLEKVMLVSWCRYKYKISLNRYSPVGKWALYSLAILLVYALKVFVLKDFFATWL